MPDLNVPREGDSTLAFTEKAFRSSIAEYLTALTLSGTTAHRPTRFLWIGRPYFDTTLGRPIWVSSLGPVRWIQADGVVL